MNEIPTKKNVVLMEGKLQNRRKRGHRRGCGGLGQSREEIENEGCNVFRRKREHSTTVISFPDSSIPRFLSSRFLGFSSNFGVPLSNSSTLPTKTINSFLISFLAAAEPEGLVVFGVETPWRDQFQDASPTR